MQFLKNPVFPGGFMPHGYCYLWTPTLVGLHVVSDSLTALSYLSIQLTLPHRFRETGDTLAIYLLRVNRPLLQRVTDYFTEVSA